MHKRILSLLFTAVLLMCIFLEVENIDVSKAASGAYVSDDSSFIYLGNDLVEIQFSKENKGLIYSFVNKLTQKDYRSIKTCQNPAWRVILTDMSTLKMYGILEEKNFTQFEFSSQNISNGARLNFRYTECGYDNLNIVITINVFDNCSNTFWRVNITCPASYNFSIDQIYLPLITGLRIGGGELTYPIVAGYGIYPAGNVEMQLAIVKDKAGGGMYWATYDADCNAKLLGRAVQDGAGGYFVTIVHYNTLRAGADYVMTYDTVLGVFEGDMDQALDIYRDWARKQWWVGNGTILQRKDLPDWFKEGFSTMIVCSYGGIFEEKEYKGAWKSVGFNELPRLVEEYAERVQSPVLLRWLGWEKYGAWISPECLPPMEGDLAFKSTIDELHRRGHHVIVGLSAGIWDTMFESYNTTGKYYTKYYRFPLPPFPTMGPSIWQDGNREIADMSLACEGWQDILVDITKYLAQAGVDGIQLDCFLSQPCDFSPLYDHPMGYGSWYTRGVLNALYKIKNAARLFNPNFLIATEFMSEPFLPFVDLFIGDQFHSGEGSIQVVPFEYVYRDYCIPIGREFYQKYSDSQYSGTQILKKAFAYASVSGILAEFNGWAEFPLPTEKALLEIAFANHALLPDFYDGRMLRRPTYFEPDVVSSVWSDNYGNLGFLYVNFGNDTRTIKVDEDLSSYAVGEGNHSIFLASVDGFDFLYLANAPSRITIDLTLEQESLLLVGVCDVNYSMHFLLRWEAAIAAYKYSSLLAQCTSRGIECNYAEDSFLEAREEKTNGNYSKSLAFACSALLKISSYIKKLGSLMNDSQSFIDSISNAETLIEEGRYFEAATQIFDACNLVLENIRLPIFFDNLHTDKDYFSSFGYDIFNNYCESAGYRVAMCQTPRLSWNEISGTKVAAFWAPCLGFTTEEVNMLLEYVNQGSDLILLLDHGMSTSINELTENFGIEVFSGAVIAQEYLWDEWSFSIDNFTVHSVTDGIASTTANVIAPMKTYGNAVPLAFTSDDTWSSDSTQLTGPFVYLAVSTYGSGKILLVADNLFMSDPVHLAILGNALSWFGGDYWGVCMVDLNSDGRINILDITIVASAYGSMLNSPKWNEEADTDQSGTINILDIAAVAKHFGKTV